MIRCLGAKLFSFDKMLTSLKPSLIFCQETKMKTPGKIITKNSKEYIFFELLRKEKKISGGGLAIGILKCLNPIWISEGDDEIEVLVTEIMVQKMKIRCVNAYGPQNIAKSDIKEKFWARLSHEVEQAYISNCGFILQMDSNSHLGNSVINGDPGEQDQNGIYF